MPLIFDDSFVLYDDERAADCSEMAVPVLARSDYHLYLPPEGSTNADSLPGSVWNGGDVEVREVLRLRNCYYQAGGECYHTQSF